MSQDKVAIALAQRLETLTPAMPIAWPNEIFKPVVGTPYLSVAFLRGEPENPAIGGTALVRHVGLMQVNAHYPVNSGEGAARRTGDLLAALFPCGASMLYSGVTVHVTRTPAVAQGFHDGAWYVVPVSIFYRADVF